MKAIDILNHFLSKASWIDSKTTVDKIIIGNPDKEIRSILVTWISSFDAVKTAADGGFDMIITHEPTFWAHANELENMDTRGIGNIKKDFIESKDLVVLRCHDVWDRMPDIGIPWAWARFLGLGNSPNIIEAGGFLHRYDIQPIDLDTFAQNVASKTSQIGESFIQVCGDKNQIVSKVGIGTGCYCNPSDFMKMDCDVSIVCDDGTYYWREIQRAVDSGHPVIRVNHGTSEEPGMVTLSEYVRKSFPGIKCTHLPHGSSFRLVGHGV